MSKVKTVVEKVIIPTYEISPYDKNPMFIEKRVYQGSSGRVYPHPVCYGVSNEKTDKEYTAIFLENDYILVMLLPELGGRVQRLYDKTNGYDAIYYNEVVKPALVGLAGPWISGGIEFNWPQHHRPSTFDPLEYTLTENDDGSATVWIGETDKMFHLKGMTGFTVYPDRAYLEIKGQVFNPTDTPKTFLWWANPAVSVNDFTQSIFPPDVFAVMDHGKRAVSEFPIARGVYYKYDYAPGTDISRYKNIPVPTSFMAYHSDFDFIGNYDEKKRAGLLHVADHHISPGKKQWTWGNGDFGRAWDRNLTDENGPYIEIMTGVFTDNQPDFSYIKPYEEKTFSQYFMPYKEVGAVSNASEKAVMNMTVKNGRASVTVYAPEKIERATLAFLENGKTVCSERISLETAGVFTKEIAAHGDDVQCALFIGDECLVCKKAEPHGDIPSPAEAIPEPENIETTEKLFLAATHLEQYRHATFSPEPYYIEGLRRDPSDIRLNNGYGKYLYNKGLFEESAKYFEAAIKSSTWKNPNPYDCEPYFNLGLALEKLGEYDKAFDAFYKSTWDADMQSRAFYKLSCHMARRERFIEALGFVEKSLVFGAHNYNARLLKTTLLRRVGRCDEARAFALKTVGIDPLDFGARYELSVMTGDTGEFEKIMRGDAHNYIELANRYFDAGLFNDAADVLALAPDGDPMANYYKYYISHDEKYLDKAEISSPLYCFPNRIEDIAVLDYAAHNGGNRAAYYLGCLYYDRGLWEKAVSLWEGCADKVNLPTVYRNLSIAYFNKLHDEKRAVFAMKTAFDMDKTDARVFYELDMLMKLTNASPAARLDNMLSCKYLLDKRDDLYIEYITLLNFFGEHEAALENINGHIFHPFEGGEGKISAQYRAALIGIAKKSDSKTAISLLARALEYPENLGEGKLIGALDNDIHYMIGCLCDDAQKKKDEFMLAARGKFDIGSAVYYNDQPPEMMYFAAKALEALGDESEARRRFSAFVEYADKHIGDNIKIDYFAVSLPDFSVFDADLCKNNKAHCLYMKALGLLGLKETERAKMTAAEGLDIISSHAGLNEIMNEISKK